MKHRFFLAVILSCALILSNFASCSEKNSKTDEKQITVTGSDTEIDEKKISVTESDTEISASLIGAKEETVQLFEEKAKEYESKWGADHSDSEISALNEKKDASCLSETGKNLLLESIKLCRETNGKLDITLLPLQRLWGFGGGENKVPDDMLISLLLSKSGMDQVKVDGDQVTLGKFTMLDLSPTQNGHAADLLALDMASSGSRGGLITMGDVVKTFGSREDGSLWEIPIPDPKNRDEKLGLLSAKGECAAATAGIYDQYFVAEDQHYCNIIDPATGYPVQNDLVSATVVARSALLADGFSTALMVMGSEEAIRFYRQRDDFDMILVLKNGDILVTSALEKTFRLSDGAEFQTIEK